MPCLWPLWWRASCGTNRHPNISPQCARKRAMHIPTVSWWAPCPPPPRRARYAYTTPPHAPGHGESPFWQTYWLGCERYSGARPVCLHNPTARTWPWGKPFLADLLAWLRALQWTEDTDTVSFIELALDFKEHAARILPAAPQAKFQGHTLPLQERARVLRLALCTLQRLVKLGSLHLAKVITRATSLVPLGGPPVAGLNCHPYFACRDAMHKHVQLLASYCESTWTLRTHTRTTAHRPYKYRRRKTEQEVEEARLQPTLTGSLNTGLMPSSSLCAKGGAGTTNFVGDFYPVMGGGKAAQAPYAVTRRRAPQPTAPATCVVAPSPMTSSHTCPAHKLPACVTCKRLRLSAAVYFAKGHHVPGYVDRRPLSKVRQTHGLPPCPRCTLMQRGVRHCCQCGHHKVNTPHKGLGKRTAPAPAGTNKRPQLQLAAPAHSRMQLRSPHLPPTPPAPKRRRPKSLIPPSLPAPRPQGMQVDDGDTAVVRTLFFMGHGRASSEVT